MSYLEDQDQWWLPGIFRDVTLLGRPAGGLDDVWLRASYAEDGTGLITPELMATRGRRTRSRSRFPSSASGSPSRGPATSQAIDVGPVEPWSAERPRLYDAEFAPPVSGSGSALGFRTVLIIGRRVHRQRPPGDLPRA